MRSSYLALGLIVGSSVAADMADAQENQATEQPPAEGGLSEIVVTAARREESVQNSSLAISVVTGEDLARAGISQPTDLQNVVPGVTVSLGGATVNTFVRGVGSFSTDANAESAIAYNINGVYISRPSGIGPIFYDLERVEVLKGPQGTLYGRNASGGAINLITARPRNEFGAQAALEAGNFDLLRLTGHVNVPVNDTFALRLATQITNRSGYLSDRYDDQESQAARLTTLWEPDDSVSLLLTGEYTHVGGKGAGPVKRTTLGVLPEDEWTGPTEAVSQPPTAALGGSRILADGDTDIDIWAVSAELNWDLGPAMLTVIPAYRDTKPQYLTYMPGFYFDTVETSEQQSLELRLSDSTETLKWVAGLYYFDENQTQLYELRAVPIQQSIVTTALTTESLAAFGEATFSLSDTFRLIGGLRYSEDEKTQSGVTVSTLPRPASTDNFGQRDFSDVSWKVGAEYDLAPENMLFLTVATGYKAGGFFPSVPFPNNAFEPEEITAYTLGSRNRFVSNRLQANVEAFYWDYENKHERFLGTTQTGQTGLLTTNAGQATLYGASADIQFALTAADFLRFNVEYLNTEYDEFAYTVYNAPPFGLAFGYAPQATGCRLGPVAPLTANDPFVPTDSTQSIDCAGLPLVRAPEWSGSLGYEHVFDIGAGAQLIPSLNAQFATEQFLTADFISSGKDDGYVVLDANLTYLSSGERWSVQAWVRNVTDEAVYTGGFRYPFSFPAPVGGDPTLLYADIRAPRSYGITATAKF